MRRNLTLLQRGVLQRLRAAHYSSLADAAADAWAHGERVNIGNIVSTREPELRADFERADGQATVSSA